MASVYGASKVNRSFRESSCCNIEIIRTLKAGLEAFNDSLRIEASPVHLVLIEPGELFSLTPMGSKQSRHYQTMKEESDHNPKEANKIENLQNFFGSLNPGLGLISEEHGVYRWDYMSGWLGILTSKLMFQTISRGSSLGKSWKTLLRHLPFTKVELSVLIIIGFFGEIVAHFRLREKLMVYSPYKIGDRLKKQLVGFDI